MANGLFNGGFAEWRTDNSIPVDSSVYREKEEMMEDISNF